MPGLPVPFVKFARSATLGRSSHVHERPGNHQDAAGFQEGHDSPQQERDFSNTCSSRGVRPHDPRSHRTLAYHDPQHIRNRSYNHEASCAHVWDYLPSAKHHLFKFLWDYDEHRHSAYGDQHHRSANDFESLRHLGWNNEGHSLRPGDLEQEEESDLMVSEWVSEFLQTPIIAVMVALSSLLVIVFIIIVLYMLRFKKYKQAGSHSNSFHLSNGRTDDTEPQSMPLLARSPSTNRKYPPLPVDKLEEEINRRMADDNKLFREEFNALPACPIQATCEAASKEENKEKNRYVNILPYDHSRVHLTPLEGVPDSDYINASFINGYQEKNKFIAAQGPKRRNCGNDFYWRMIWEQNTAITTSAMVDQPEREERVQMCSCTGRTRAAGPIREHIRECPEKTRDCLG
uniref:Uncharacterized protein n=1 Tax=Sphaerodactylus townsendi TaxID=933632 RepID=A0ACB8E988_9SAUR